MNIISIRKHPIMLEKAIAYFQKNWASEETNMIYDDAIRSSLITKQPLPQWYLLMDDTQVIGCAGLITNDFISRMDLYPWVCALFIKEYYRGHHFGSLLIKAAKEDAKEDAKEASYKNVYLCTDHIGYYEHYGFHDIGVGYHPWGESSRIYMSSVNN